MRVFISFNLQNKSFNFRQKSIEEFGLTLYQCKSVEDIMEKFANKYFIETFHGEQFLVCYRCKDRKIISSQETGN